MASIEKAVSTSSTAAFFPLLCASQAQWPGGRAPGAPSMPARPRSVSWSFRLLGAASLIAVVIGMRLGGNNAGAGEDAQDHLDAAVSLSVSFTGAPELL